MNDSVDTDSVDHAEFSPAPRRRRRGFKTVTLLVLTGVAFVAWANHRGQSAHERLGYRMAQAGIDLSVIEHTEREEPNEATRAYLAAFALLSEDLYVSKRYRPSATQRVPTPLPCEPYGIKYRYLLEADSERPTQGLAQLATATTLGNPVIQIQWEPWPGGQGLEAYGQLRRAARWAETSARAAAASGDTQGCARDIEMIFRLARCLDADLHVVTDLVQNSVESLGTYVVLDELSRVQFTVDELDQIQAALNADPGLDRFLACQSYELVEMHDWFSEPGTSELVDRVHRYRNQQRVTEHLGDLVDPDPSWYDPWLQRATWTAVIWCPGWFQLDRVENLNRQFEALERCRTTLEQGESHQLLGWARESFDLEDSPEKMVYTNLRSSILAQDRRTVTLAALDVERFRVTHGRWPEDLTETNSSHTLDTAGLPLRLLKSDDGVVVYSAGLNGLHEDARSRFDGEHALEENARADDITFRLYDPDQRGTRRPMPGETPGSTEPGVEMGL